MNKGDFVIANGREGTLVYLDSPWNLPNGEPADLLCKVLFEKGESSFFRLSELKKSERLKETVKNMKAKIEFEEFLEIQKRLEIKIGSILEVERMPKSNKMLKLTVFFGGEECTVMTNIGKDVEAETLKGRKFPFVTNLKPATIMGVESSAMIMVPSMLDGTIDFSEQPLAGSILL